MDFRSPVQALIPGAQGKILSVMTRAGEPLNLRTIAELAGVSAGQTSRVLGRLVGLGLVERRDVPPIALFRLLEGNLASQFVLQLTQLRRSFLDRAATSALSIEPAPVNVTIFGSMARDQVGPESDIDLLVVRAAGTTPEDDLWAKSLGMFEHEVETLAGNNLSVVEVAEEELPELLTSSSELWRQIRDEGIHLLGVPLSKTLGND
ncbi:MAG: MarR family transcriptional regulator [Actinomycetota bacterium]